MTQEVYNAASWQRIERLLEGADQTIIEQARAMFERARDSLTTREEDLALEELGWFVRSCIVGKRSYAGG